MSRWGMEYGYSVNLLSLAVAIVVLGVILLVSIALFMPPQMVMPSLPTAPAPAPTPTPTPTPAPTAVVSGIAYSEELAARGLDLFKQHQCDSCHTIKSLGVPGSTAGPDLSKVLLGNRGVPGSVIMRWYKEHGLENPEADPSKAAELLYQFLVNPPAYSRTYSGWVAGIKASIGEEGWRRDSEAILELLKKAATR